MKMSYKLVVAFIAAVILPVSIVSGLMIQRAQEQAIDHFTESNEREVQQINRSLTLFFGEIEKNVNYLANHRFVPAARTGVSTFMHLQKETMSAPLQNSSQEANLFNLYKDFAATHPDLAYVYYGNTEGGYVQWPAGIIECLRS
ncbi:MAG: methyl-accepting chemotaxis protein [Flavobacterium sp.]|jgi:methyl-accepting chemotaxis protein